ncbi:MAG TPA: nitrous oxide-stimulated promoter family protein [Coriobacteriia bacterium]|nr:nitrous oxide-stimulated promoter family protein [Coriobacteriia bacterium]
MADGRFAERMSDRDVVRDTRLLGDFAVIYCRDNHHGAERARLDSDAASLGAYGRTPPVVCDRCAGLLRYAERRRAFCPKDPKPFCSHCDTHCYAPAEREFMREVMRYSGPRSITRGHALDSLRHLLAERRARRHARGPHGTGGTT